MQKEILVTNDGKTFENVLVFPTTGSIKIEMAPDVSVDEISAVFENISEFSTALDKNSDMHANYDRLVLTSVVKDVEHAKVVVNMRVKNDMEVRIENIEKAQSDLEKSQLVQNKAIVALDTEIGFMSEMSQNGGE